MKFDAMHPGIYLYETIIEEEGHQPEELALCTGLSLNELEALFDGRSNIDDHIAKSLAKGLGTSHQFWLNMQSQYAESVLRKQSFWTMWHTKWVSVWQHLLHPNSDSPTAKA